MNIAPSSHQMTILGGVLLLLVRGVFLLIVIPVTLWIWLVTWPFLRRRGATLGQLLGWVDLNLVALLQRTLLRLVTRTPLPWTPVSQLPRVAHRIRWMDPA